MFFDEEMLLDLRLNIMNKYVDKFVITESTYMHSGKSKKLIFDINKFPKFKDKIIYILSNQNLYLSQFSIIYFGISFKLKVSSFSPLVHLFPFLSTV